MRRTASRKLRASAKTSQAVGHGDADDASQDLSGCEPELPRKAKPAPCSHRAPVLRPADGIFRCRLCPFQRATAHLAQYRQVNTQHYKCHHGGATLPGPLRRPRVGKVSGGAKNRFWKCPRCTQGVSKEVRAKLMKKNHPGLSDPQGFAAGCRARALQKRSLAEVAQLRFPGMQTFVWPIPVFAVSPGCKAKTDHKRRIRRISLQHAWKCQKCGEVSQVLSTVRQHSKGPCPPVARREFTKKRRQAKLELMREWVRDSVESPAERQILSEALAGASAAMQCPSFAQPSSEH